MMINRELLKTLEKLSLKVSKELVYFADGYEDELSSLLSFELKKNNISHLREVRNYHQSDYVSVKFDRPDFYLLPDKSKNIKTPILVECKFGNTENLKKGREELFRYLMSHKNSTSKDFNKIKQGILLMWHEAQINPSKPYKSRPQKIPEQPLVMTKDSSKEWQRKLKEFDSKVSDYLDSVLLQDTYYIKPNSNRKVIIELWEIENDNKKFSKSIIEFSKKYSNLD